MNSYGKSGFQNSSDMNPNFEFNTPGGGTSSNMGGVEKPTFSSISSLSRPRYVKMRKSMHSKSMNSPGTRNVDPGFNPFQPVSDNVPGVSSRLDSDASDGIGNESGVLGGGGVSMSNRSRYVKNLKGINKVEKVGNELIDEIRKLRIENQRIGSQCDSKIELPSRGVGDGLSSKLPEDLKRMSLGGPVSGGLNVSGVASDGQGGARSVGVSFASTLAAELPNNLNRLNLREGGEVGGRSFVFGAPSNGDFVFGSNGTNSGVIDPGINSILPDNMRNLKLEDPSVNDGSQAFVSGDKRTESTSNGVDTMILDDLEKLKIGSNSGVSRDHANPNDSSSNPNGGMGNEDSINSDVRENISQDKDTSAPQVPGCQMGSVPSQPFGSSNSSFTSARFNFQSVRGEYQVPCSEESKKKEGFSFTGKPGGPQMASVEFRTPETKGILSTGSNLKTGFNSRKGSTKVAHHRGRKGKANEPNAVLVSLVKNIPTNDKSIQEEPPSESYSPMDISPYCDTQDDAQSAVEPSLTSENQAAFTSQAASSVYELDKDLVAAAERMDINEGDDVMHGESKVQASECVVDNCVNEDCTVADCFSEAEGEGESFKTATANLDNDGESEVESKYEPGSCDQSQYFSASSSISSGGSSFTFAASSSSHSQGSAPMRYQKKKNRMKAGPEIFVPPVTASFSDATSSQQISPISRVSVLPSQVDQNDGLSTSLLKGVGNLNIASPTSRTLGGDSLEGTKKGNSSPTVAARQAQEACDKWRLRGNQAYANGDLEKAEDYYTNGLGCIPQHETSRECLRSLVLCYSNLAATRMSLGRIREALQDCLVAAKLDHNFRVLLRAANCYLALGEISDASLYFKKLLQSTDACVERKIIVEASEGLQKAQKVSECVIRSGELLLRGTSCDAKLALEVNAEALVISPYSEQLLERKAEALLMLRKYEEVIQLCEQTLKAAEKNSYTLTTNEESSNLDVSEFLKSYSFRMWRYGFMFKSNFYLGKLEEAFDFLEKQENWRYMVAKYGSETFESVIPQISTARELIRLKSAGNGAFQAGKHAEAVEHYTSALSFNVESRPFAAVCFGNRAAAYQALGQITDAVADCSLAIALDGNYLKAISRRATLFEMIRDYDQAAKDLQRLVSLLTEQAEGKANLMGTALSTSSVVDLRQARQRLYQMEELDKKEIPLNFYLILGVEPSVSATDLKKAYRKAALRHHPDKAGQSLTRGESGDDVLWKEIAEEAYKDADKLFKMIGEAYAVLSDPTKRPQYDMEEEMRNGQKKSGGNMSRMHTDATYYAAERGSVGRQWREGWRTSANPYTRGFEPSADPYSRGFEPSRPGRYY